MGLSRRCSTNLDSGLSQVQRLWNLITGGQAAGMIELNSEHE